MGYPIRLFCFSLFCVFQRKRSLCVLFLSIHTFLPDRNGDAWITTHSAGHVPALFFVPGYLARQLFMDYNKKKQETGLMPMNMNFYMPTRVIIEKDSIRRHASLFGALGRRVLLVTGAASARRSGALADVTAALDAQGIAWTVYDGIRQNPAVTDCQQAGQSANTFGAAYILGIGGGSVLDAAKAIAVFAANPGMDQAGLYRLDWPQNPLPIVCVGTTAGTGSEVTAVAVLTRQDGTKKSITHDSLYPTLSITDPVYTAGMPDEFTRSTAVDALAHCVESWFSRKANRISRCWAAEGVRILLPRLKKIADSGCSALDEEDRTALYQGSVYGGLAISVTGTLFPHTIGYPLTEQFGIPHGTACAVFLPDLLAHIDICAPRSIDAFCGSCGCTREELVQTVRSVTPACPVTMSRELIASLAPRWQNNRSLTNTPGTVDADFVSGLYTRLFGR